MANPFKVIGNALKSAGKATNKSIGKIPGVQKVAGNLPGLRNAFTGRPTDGGLKGPQQIEPAAGAVAEPAVPFRRKTGLARKLL